MCGTCSGVSQFGWEALGSSECLQYDANLIYLCKVFASYFKHNSFVILDKVLFKVREICSLNELSFMID